MSKVFGPEESQSHRNAQFNRASVMHPKVALLLLLSLISMPLIAQAQPQQQPAPPFADAAFQSVWARTDKPVADGAVKRGYYWGPQPGAAKQEAYQQGTGGARLVQYFDKSRMEINDPNRDKNGAFYDAASVWIRNHPGASQAELARGMRQVWDSIDNRFGEMVQDNIFWNTTLKQSMQLAMRSYSWNMGTFREIGGGVAFGRTRTRYAGPVGQCAES